MGTHKDEGHPCLPPKDFWRLKEDGVFGPAVLAAGLIVARARKCRIGNDIFQISNFQGLVGRMLENVAIDAGIVAGLFMIAVSTRKHQRSVLLVLLGIKQVVAFFAKSHRHDNKLERKTPGSDVR